MKMMGFLWLYFMMKAGRPTEANLLILIKRTLHMGGPDPIVQFFYGS